MRFIVYGSEQLKFFSDAVGQVDLGLGWEIVLRRHKKGRSLAQNRLFWKWMDEIRLYHADNWGRHLSKDEWHDLMCEFLLPTREIEVFGVVRRVHGRTSTLKVEEFSEFLQRIDEWARGKGIMLPHPDDLYFEAMGLRK